MLSTRYQHRLDAGQSMTDGAYFDRLVNQEINATHRRYMETMLWTEVRRDPQQFQL